eukprot:1729576-Rhodomonas_salina.1
MSGRPSEMAAMPPWAPERSGSQRAEREQSKGASAEGGSRVTFAACIACARSPRRSTNDCPTYCVSDPFQRNNKKNKRENRRQWSHVSWKRLGRERR